METRKMSLSPGNHIFIQRSIHYAHHGIYVGDNKVIHFQTPMEKGHLDPSSCRVIESDIDTFLDEDENLYLFRYGVSKDKAKLYYKGMYTTKPCDAPEVVIDRARKSIKEGFSHYNIVGNNCEDFATYCKTGQRSMESAQFSTALECVAAARRAMSEGYRSPLVYAGCVFGMFHANDFKFPPKNNFLAHSEFKDVEDKSVENNPKNKCDCLIAERDDGIREIEASTDIIAN